MRLRATLMALGLAGCGGQTDSNSAAARDCTAFEQSALDAQAAALHALEVRLHKVQAELGAACSKLASDLGVPPATAGRDPASLTVDEVVAACDLAENALPSQALDSLSISATAGFCYVDAPTQLACEADCVHSEPCDVGTIESRCAEGHLQQVCEGPCVGAESELRCESELMPLSCQGNATCDAACAALGELTGNCGPSGVEVLVAGDPALTELLAADLPPIVDARRLTGWALKASSKLLLTDVGPGLPSSCKDAEGRSESDHAEEWLVLNQKLKRLTGVVAVPSTR